MNDFAVVATVLAKPSFTLSIMLGGSASVEVEVEVAAAAVVLGAWSPANLEGVGVSMGIGLRYGEEGEEELLIRHDDEEAFGGIFVGLELVVAGVDAAAGGEEEEEFGGEMGVVGWFGDVDLRRGFSKVCTTVAW